MSLIALPYNLGYERLSWGLNRNVAMNESPLSRKIQRLLRAGDCWKATAQWPPLQGVEALHMAAFIDQLSAGDGNVFLEGFQLGTLRFGSLLTPDLLAGIGGFQTAADVALWSATNATLAWNARHLRVTNTTAAAGNANKTVATISGSNYVLLADTVPGWTGTWKMVATSTVNFTTATRGSVVFAGTGGNVTVRLGNTGAVSGDRVQFANASVALCLLVNGGSQTGKTLAFDGAPASALTNALYAGEFVTVITSTAVNSATPRYELKRLTEDVEINSSGAGTIAFEPPLHNSPADNAGIILHKGFSKMYLPKHSSEFNLDGPNKHGFTMDFMEELE